MSTEGFEREQHALRLAVGVAIAFTVPIVLGWRLSFMLAIFTVLLLATMRRAPTIRQFVGFTVVFGLATEAALIVSVVVRGTPAGLVLTTGIALFLALRASARGDAPLPIMLTLIAFTVMPFAVISAEDVAPYMQPLLVGAGAGAFAVAWLAHFLFPSRSTAPSPAPQAARTTADQSEFGEREAVRNALCATVVLLGAEIFALVTNLPSRFVIVMTVVSIAQHYARAGSMQVAIGLLVANVIGGIAATIAYEILCFAPSPTMLALVILLAGLVFGRFIAAAGPRAQVFVPAFITAIILLGQSLLPITDDAAQSFVNRLVAVLVAAVIACIGLVLLDAVTRPRKHRGAPSVHAIKASIARL
jgi:uncharacterized membrane protein YccC